MQWRNDASKLEFQGLFPWCHGTVAEGASVVATVLNTAEDQFRQLVGADSPVAWQNPKTFGESEGLRAYSISWHFSLTMAAARDANL